MEIALYTGTSVRHEPPRPFFLERGVAAFPVHWPEMFIIQKCTYFKKQEVLGGPPLKIADISKGL